MSTNNNGNNQNTNLNNVANTSGFNMLNPEALGQMLFSQLVMQKLGDVLNNNFELTPMNVGKLILLLTAGDIKKLIERFLSSGFEIIKSLPNNIIELIKKISFIRIIKNIYKMPIKIKKSFSKKEEIKYTKTYIYIFYLHYDNVLAEQIFRFLRKQINFNITEIKHDKKLITYTYNCRDPKIVFNNVNLNIIGDIDFISTENDDFIDINVKEQKTMDIKDLVPSYILEILEEIMKDEHYIQLYDNIINEFDDIYIINKPLRRITTVTLIICNIFPLMDPKTLYKYVTAFYMLLCASQIVDGFKILSVGSISFIKDKIPRYDNSINYNSAGYSPSLQNSKLNEKIKSLPRSYFVKDKPELTDETIIIKYLDKNNNIKNYEKGVKSLNIKMESEFKFNGSVISTEFIKSLQQTFEKTNPKIKIYLLKLEKTIKEEQIANPKYIEKLENKESSIENKKSSNELNDTKNNVNDTKNNVNDTKNNVNDSNKNNIINSEINENIVDTDINNTRSNFGDLQMANIRNNDYSNYNNYRGYTHYQNNHFNSYKGKYDYTPYEPKFITKESIIKNVKAEFVNETSKDITTLFLREHDIKLLNRIVEDFKKGKKKYEEFGMTYKLNMLLHGEPGTGKSSSIIAIATYLQRDIYYLDLKSCETNDDLKAMIEHAVKNVSTPGIIVMEEIDKMCNIVLKNTNNENENDNISGTLIPDKHNNSELIKSEKNKLSLDYLLNVLQGTLTIDNTIVIITTNHLDRIEPALYRQGRMDIVIDYKLCDRYQIKIIYKKMMNKDLSDEILNQIPENKFKPVEIIYHLFQHMYLGMDDIELMKKFIIL